MNQKKHQSITFRAATSFLLFSLIATPQAAQASSSESGR